MKIPTLVRQVCRARVELGSMTLFEYVGISIPGVEVSRHVEAGWGWLGEMGWSSLKRCLYLHEQQGG
jgi:hypothetical protein